jgi:hypothetical protein
VCASRVKADKMTRHKLKKYKINIEAVNIHYLGLCTIVFNFEKRAVREIV